MQSNRRQEGRVGTSLPVELKLDEQVTVSGRLKDISPKSAFIQMKESVYLKLNDELRFFIRCAADDLSKGVAGVGRVSRIAQGEGIAIYFTDLDKNSARELEALLKK